jgi:regulator of protease activity HflC (stomatin/prohibitin superfamily)
MEINTGLIVLIIIVVLALILVKKSLIIIPQSETKIVERLGKYYATLQPGINLIIPFIDRANDIVTLNRGRYVYSNTIDLREQVYDFDKQNVITKDNIQMQINALLYFQIVDPFKAAYEISNLPNAIEKLTQTTLRNIIGELELDQTLTSREIINTKMRTQLDVATDPWGIKVNRVELKNIFPPREIQDAMEKQMKAERERREAILRAEGEKASAVLVAEGEKEAKILAAEADKQSAILRAEAVKEAKIRESEGEAAAILAINDAKAKGIELINQAKPSEAMLRMRSLAAFVKAADGKATKLIIPSDIQGAVGVASALKETLTNN